MEDTFSDTTSMLKRFEFIETKLQYNLRVAKKNIFNAEFQCMCDEEYSNSIESKRPYYRIHKENEEFSKNIVNIFENYSEKVIGLIKATPQVGKSEICLHVIYNAMNSNILKLNIDNIYYITGLSDVDWKKQTIARFPPCFENQIHHRDDLKKINPKTKFNHLFIIDEAHIAKKENNTISTIFNDIFHFRTMDFLYTHNIKILVITATPEDIIRDINRWDVHGFCETFIPNDNYFGFKYFIENDKIKQSFNILSDNEKFIELITTIKSYIKPKYHIIRINKKYQTEITNKIKNDINNCKFLEYYEEHKFDINDILKNEPTLHTFIFVLAKLRCSKTLNYTENLGILFDRASSRNPSTVIQGLAGRMCGYNYNGQTICYTDVKIITSYIDNEIKLKPSRLRNVYDQSLYPQSIPIECGSSCSSSYNSSYINENNPELVRFLTYEDMKKYFIDNVKIDTQRGPSFKTLHIIDEKTGLYLSNIRGISKVRTFEEIFLERKTGLSSEKSKCKWRSYTFYTKVNKNGDIDPESKEYCLIYYKR